MRSQDADFPISVVTPTLNRPDEVEGLLWNLAAQTLPPVEVILVDGAPSSVRDTEFVVQNLADKLAFNCRYVRSGGGTAIQRNRAIDIASSRFIAFVDDDVRLERNFFEVVAGAFAQDHAQRIGGVAGCVTNEYLDADKSARWRWYRRLKLFTTYEPGRFDFGSGYPINRYLQPPHDTCRTIDFMGANCAVWRREVFDEGHRFSEFFTGFGVAEDAHFALKASARWQLLECGSARCTHLRSPHGRTDERTVAWKTAVNYRYLFVDLVPRPRIQQEIRFWSVQCIDLCRQIAWALRRGGRQNWIAALGKLQGIIAATRVKAPSATASKGSRCDSL